MKPLLLSLTLLFAASSVAQAGGNTSIVELDKVKSIKIEKEKITIVGSGKLKRRVLSDSEHGDASVFGQPAQMLYAKFHDCTFEVIPYHLRSDVSGVPGPDPDNLTPAEKARSLEWWEGTLKDAKEIKPGDAIKIAYQREKMTITSVFVTHIVGSGSLSVIKPASKKP